MAGQDSTQVIVPGVGRIWQAPVDTLAPGYFFTTGGASAGTLTMTGVTVTTGSIPFNATAATVAAAWLTALPSLASHLFVFPATVSGLGGWYVLFDPTITPGAVSTTGTGLTGGTATVTPGGLFTAYAELGYTDHDSPFTLTRSGGDVTTLDAWQAAAIESSTAAVTWSASFPLLQNDLASQKLYYGSNTVIGTNGLVQAPAAGASTQAALAVLISNNGKAQLRHWPRTSIVGSDNQTFDTAKLNTYPVTATILQSSSVAYPFQSSQVGVAV